MSVRFFCLFCLLLGFQALQSQEEKNPKKKDQSLLLLKQADEIFLRRQYEKATILYQQVAKQAEKEKEPEVLIEALSQIARGFLIQGKAEEGKFWLEKAKEKFKNQTPEKYPLGWSRYVGVLGRFQWKAEQKKLATKTFKEMYEFCLKHQLHSRAIDAAHMVAITGNSKEQIFWGKKGIEAAEKGKLEGWLGPLWNNLGWTYDEKGDYQAALEALIKAREYHWRFGSEHAKLVADWSIGHINRKLKQYEKALNWLRPTLAWAQRRYREKEIPDRAEWIGLTLQELGEIEVLQGELKEALSDLKEAQKYLQIAKMPEWDSKGYEKLSRRIEEVALLLKK